MKAQFDVYQTPDPEKEEGKNRYHARLLSNGTVRIDQLVYEINETSSFSPADVRGVLQAFFDAFVFHLRAGENIELEGIGHFSVSIKSPVTEAPEEIRTGQVRFKAVHYRCSVAMKDKLKTMPIVRALKEEDPGYTEQDRKTRILTFLHRKEWMSSSDCMQLNECTRYRALKDLKSLEEEGRILMLGRRKAAYYMLKK